MEGGDIIWRSLADLNHALGWSNIYLNKQITPDDEEQPWWTGPPIIPYMPDEQLHEDIPRAKAFWKWLKHRDIYKKCPGCRKEILWSSGKKGPSEALRLVCCGYTKEPKSCNFVMKQSKFLDYIKSTWPEIYLTKYLGEERDPNEEENAKNEIERRKLSYDARKIKRKIDAERGPISKRRKLESEQETIDRKIATIERDAVITSVHRGTGNYWQYRYVPITFGNKPTPTHKFAITVATYVSRFDSDLDSNYTHSKIWEAHGDAWMYVVDNLYTEPSQYAIYWQGNERAIAEGRDSLPIPGRRKHYIKGKVAADYLT